MKKSKIAILSIVSLTATIVIGGTIMTVEFCQYFGHILGGKFEG